MGPSWHEGGRSARARDRHCSRSCPTRVRLLWMGLAPAPRDRAFTGVFALLASATACAIVALSAPRPVEPSRLPALRLPPAQLERQQREDAALRQRVPTGPDVDALMRLYRAEGEAEHAHESDPEQRDARRRALAMAAAKVFGRLDVAAARALMLHTSERALAALRGELADAAEARGLLGVVPSLLARYGYHEDDGSERGPRLALRAFYAARFNLICERPLLASFSLLERTAHAGFSALHAGGLEPTQRARAAADFAALGGIDGVEADAIWRFQGGSRTEALKLLRHAHARSGMLRLRNMALYVEADLSH